MLDKRAHSLVVFKAIDDDARIIEGTASSPALDTDGDTLDPKGAEYSLPMPLLWQHRSDEPIGFVTAARVTDKGITIRAQIAKGVSTRIDEAWALIKGGLVRGLSVGAQLKEYSHKPTGGLTVTKWRWRELSAVTIPANQEASISLVKSADANALALLGTGAARHRSHTRPAVAGAKRTGTVMNIAEQLASVNAQMTESTDLLNPLMQKSIDGDSLTPEEVTERETLTGKVTELSKQRDTLEALQKAMGGAAQPIAVKSVGLTPQPKVEVVNLAKGVRFARVAMAIAAGKGSISDTMEYAKRWKGQTPEVFDTVKRMVTKAIEGTSVVGSPAWGGELVNPDTAMTEFVELLMPETIIGKVNGFDQVPFNIPIITQTGGSTFDWVEEGDPKPVGELAFERDTMGYAKCAGIVVLTEELVRLSTPKAEARVRDDMIKQCRKFLDEQFIRVGNSAGTSSPASITNGVASPAASGTDVEALRLDLMTAMQTFTAASIPLTGLVIVMTPELALGISLMTNALGQTPNGFNVTPTGGTLLGFPVIVSESVDSGTIVIFKPSEIFLADDGQVRIDASNQATLDMAGGSTPTFSLWQKNCIALRAERWINWKKKRAAVVAIIDTAAYAPSGS
jgi:HK97 family phage major capsid protein/HK97 family phage prohead protease